MAHSPSNNFCTSLAKSTVVGRTGEMAANAANAAKGCVTQAEYRVVKEGWAKGRVHRKFGTAGRRLSFDRYDTLLVEFRTYPGCRSKYSRVTIAYNQWVGKDRTLKVGRSGKSASGL